jgi:hypothetical protein
MNPETAGPQPEQVAVFFRQHRTGWFTLLRDDL